QPVRHLQEEPVLISRGESGPETAHADLLAAEPRELIGETALELVECALGLLPVRRVRIETADPGDVLVLQRLADPPRAPQSTQKGCPARICHSRVLQMQKIGRASCRERV